LYVPEEKEESQVDLQAFDREMRSYVGSGKKYDIALMLSGGKDSAYILHRLRQEYSGLRIACILVNNGFMSPVAIDNAKQTALKCEADLMIVNSFIPEFKAAFRQAFLGLKGQPCYGVVDYADGSLVFQAGEKIAKSMGLPAMIGGLSWVQVEIILGIDGFEQIADDNFRTLFPLWAWRTHEQDIREYVLEHRLIPKGNDSPVVSNSQLILAMSAIDVMNLGYCSFEPEFAKLVREGKADRKVWLHLFELLEYGVKKGHLDKDVKATLAKLDLSLEEVVGHWSSKPM